MRILSRGRLYHTPKNVYFVGAKDCAGSFELCAGVFFKQALCCTLRGKISPLVQAIGAQQGTCGHTIAQQQHQHMQKSKFVILTRNCSRG